MRFLPKRFGTVHKYAKISATRGFRTMCQKIDQRSGTRYAQKPRKRVKARQGYGVELEYMLSPAIWTPDGVSAYAEYNGSAPTETNG